MSEAAPAPRGWKANLALLLASLLVTGVVLAAAGEFAVRYHEAHRQSVPGTEPFLWYRHNRLIQALVRNNHYYDWAHVNAQGFRGAAPTPLHADGAFRIMVVGASTTFDAFVTRDEFAWPAQLQDWLNAHGGGRRFDVVNAGVPGYVLLDNMIRLQTELYRYQPDLILLFHGHNEIGHFVRDAATAASRPPRATSSSGPTRPGEIAPIAPWTYWLENHSLLYSKIVAKWLALRWVSSGSKMGRSPALSDSSWQRVIEAGAETYRHDLDAFLAVAQANHLKVVLLPVVTITPADRATEPDSEIRQRWRFTVPMASPEVVLSAYRRINQVTKEEAAHYNAPYMETAGYGLTGKALYATGDPIHFNDAGARKMAAAVGESLVAQRLLGP